MTPHPHTPPNQQTISRWDYAVPNYTRAALALQSLVGEGMVKHVGLTNFDLPRTRELMAAGVRVAAQQVQLSLLDDRPVRSGLVAHAEK